jgi:PleD family two-component response regulator
MGRSSNPRTAARAGGPLLRVDLAQGKFSPSPSEPKAPGWGTAAERAAERVVLVVEDDATVRQYMARVLGDAGFRVLVTHHGKEAMALLTTLGPSVVCLVVSDIGMPQVTGVELAAEITQRWPNGFTRRAVARPDTGCSD